MKTGLALIALLALAACGDPEATAGGGSAPSAPQRTESVQINKDATVYDVTYMPADPMTGGPKVTVARRGGAFMITDKEKALVVAQQYCDENGRRPVIAGSMIANRVDGVWEFVNLCQ
ncbi:hypothetical protein L0V05_12125 [Tabrizicola sp. J26]|uniref:hypothetical protein n=1 Tax=Alitabrizicola rongguiensis TaxID=2909234 RepID=UPI001F40397A|nr:hypothetical protein [Tabrizicola rongguiensis]MCF1709562.1 hypothetical protein [Tabrizicola rongguiensis]